MDNLHIWNAVRAVPDTAKRPIEAGRLKGKSDINPVWRLKTLTDTFGPVGYGWRYEIRDQHLERGAKDEVAAFVTIDLYVNDPTLGWSQPIPGTGGSMFVALEKSGLYTSDECYKMALTDAISVACKALGIGADVYWDKDASKYDKPEPKPDPKPADDNVAEWSESKVRAYIFRDVPDNKGGKMNYQAKAAIDKGKAGQDWLLKMAGSDKRSKLDRDVATRAAALCVVE